MIDAVNDVLFPYVLDRLVDKGFVSVLDKAYELLGPQVLEVVLHFAEDKFYWVVVWTVGQIVNKLEVHVPHGLL